MKVTQMHSTSYAETYHPRKTLDHPEFRVLEKGEKLSRSFNLAAFYNPQHEIHLVQKPYPKPGPGQVCVHVRATGICGTDVHLWKHGKFGNSTIATDECGAGHASAGEVFEVGEGVTQWKPGDRVAIEAGLPCSLTSCEPCRLGRYNTCPRIIFFSTPPYHGTLCRWHLHPATWLHRLPDNMSFEEGALCEPLAVALAAIDRISLRLGDSVLISGASPIGLICLLCAKAAGADPIVITDIVQSRLDFAKSLYSSVRTVLVTPGKAPKDVAAQIREAADGPVKIVLECTGDSSSIHTGIYSARCGGKVLVVGVGKGEPNLPVVYLFEKEIDVGFLYRQANQYPRAIRLVSRGIIQLVRLMTHKFRLEDAIMAFHTAADPAQGAIKVLVVD